MESITKNKDDIKDFNGQLKRWTGKFWKNVFIFTCSNCGKKIIRPKGKPGKLPYKQHFCNNECKRKFQDPLGEQILNHISTNEFIYFMGLLATDGNVYYSKDKKRYVINLVLKTSDNKILYKLQKIFGGFVREKSNNTTSWFISNQNFAKYLLSIGIVEKKSLILDMTVYFNSLTFDQKFHFIRGVIEGDGWISVGFNKKIKVGLSSCSKNFIEMIFNYLKMYVNSVNNIRKSLKSMAIIPIYEFEFSCNKAIKILYKLYENLNDDNLFIDRKRNNFLKHLKFKNISLNEIQNL